MNDQRVSRFYVPKEEEGTQFAMRVMQELVVRRAEEVLPALQEGVALLPGCRDRQSRPLLFIPSKEQAITGDGIRHLLHYLCEVTAEDVRDKGIVIVIDMRGKQSNNAKLFLKAIDDLCSSASVHSVLIIKPERFWDNKKAQLSIGSTKYEVQWIGADQLIKYVDVTQVPREVGGSYPYHHEEWLKTRIELERWIWKMTNILGGLEEFRRAMVETDQRMGDVTMAKRFIDNHNAIRDKILTLCPIDTLHAEHNAISSMINNPQSGVHNPDLKAALPYTKNLIDSCVATKEKVFNIWKEKYEELENAYQFKLYEQDADEKLRWIRHHSNFLAQSMGDIGKNEAEANERLKQFDDIDKTVKNSDVTLDQLLKRSARLKSVGTPHRSKVERSGQQIIEEWERLKALLLLRRTIVTSAAAFFRHIGHYFSNYRGWIERPGIDPSKIDTRDEEHLNAILTEHEDFKINVETIYADVIESASKLKQNLKAGGAQEALEYIVARTNELSKAQKILHDKIKDNRIKLHSMLAYTVFHVDTRRVLEWLDAHGDSYLRKNVKIGDNEEQAKHLQRNHDQFRRIAENTYLNADKLFEASKMIAESGVADAARMRLLLGDLEVRLTNFREKSNIRKRILDHSLLFHIHFNELTTWYASMEEKYNIKIISDNINDCEAAKEAWVQENDATAHAFATTMGEGTELINEIRQNQHHFETDYTASVNRVIDLMKKLEETNARFTNRWAIQRQILDISCTYSLFKRDVDEVISQIQNWEEDMHGMINSPTFVDNAIKVKPYHEDNFIKVKEAVSQIKSTSKEILQMIHGSQMTELKTARGDTVLTVIQEKTRLLNQAEKQVTLLAQQTSEKIEYALRLNQQRQLAAQLISTYERLETAMLSIGPVCIPENFQDACLAMDNFNNFKVTIEHASIGNSELARRFFKISNDLIASNKVPRNYPTELNEKVTNQWRRLFGQTEERHKLLSAAETYYKTCDTLPPILDQLEKISSTPPHHICKLGDDFESKASMLAKELSRHEEWKEKFVKAFHYAQKTSETFIKYIRRSNMGKNNREIEQREADVLERKSALRERQSNIFAMWTKKKHALESCQKYILFEMSRKENSDWLDGEGRAQLTRFQGHAKQLTAAANRDSILDDFCRFKISVKEKRTTIQTLLTVSKEILTDADIHRQQIEMGMLQIRDRFEQFSRAVGECEAVLRGGKPAGSKDELSLDRNSDNSVGERLEAVGTAVSQEMKKMREPVEELIKTEQKYVKDLQQCIETYIREFDAAAAHLPIALRGRRKEIFANIQEIFDFHSKSFLPELLKYENDPEAVGCSFTFYVDFLSRLYTEYCANMDTCNDIMMQPESIKFFGDIHKKYEQLELLPSLLIKPVQRITKYKLLIENLLKMTEAVIIAKGETNSHRNIEEIRDAYDVVQSVPKRANDMIHLNNLELKKNEFNGAFVMQDTLTVWEPKTFFNRGKERQVFLFELAIVVAKKIDMPSKAIRYIPKGKAIQLGSITVVEHVEGDVSRFGLRMGNESSNDNRIDFKAKDEKEKITWVKKIREYQASLSVPQERMGGVHWDSLGSLGSSSVGTRSSKVSTSSGERTSRDGDSLLDGNRHSIHSCGSNEGASDQWHIRSDFQAHTEGQLTVRAGEKVETLDQQPTDSTDWMAVVVVDNPSRTGLVPTNLLLPDQPSSSTDRPDTSNGGSVVKRKSLRRIFANSAKEQKNSSSSTAPPVAINQEPSASSAVPPPSNQTLPTEVPVIVSSAPESTPADDEPLEGLPPPMEELSLNSTAAHMNEDNATEQGSIREEEADAPKAEEKSPEEVARFKRHYVLMELVETEKDYVRDLTSVVEGYIANLEQMELPQELQGKDKIIFANIAQILDFHRTCFLKEIEKCLENYEAAASAFVKYQRRLDALYVKYCQNKPKSDYLVSQDEFEVFFAETKAKLGHKVALCDLLIKPVQRIMKYQLLLKDILKFTERANDSTVQLKKALQVMHVVPKACDDMMQVGRLQNFDGNLTAQGRLIHQGTLSIAETMGSNTQKAKDRRIFLFEQSAIIADHIPPKKEFGNPTYIFKNQIMVNKMQFLKNTNPDEPLKFIIGSTDTAQPNFLAIAQTQEEKDEWVQKVEDMLDQQKRMLEQLVNPKKFMGGDDISGGLAGMSLGGSKAPPARCPAAPAKSPAKAESPKKEKSKLFGFGKKPSAKSPTSPNSRLPAVASCPYLPIVRGDVALEADEAVEILQVKGSRATVEKSDGSTGTVPRSFLEPGNLRGNSLVEQIEYRSKWLSAVDGTTSKRAMSSPLTGRKMSVVSKPVWSDGRPEFVRGINDIRVREGDRVELAPLVLSTVPYSLVWRGPALEAGRASIETEGTHSRLIIPSILAADMGPYSVVAENEFGICSQVALVTVAGRPAPPSNLRVRRTGAFSLRLDWDKSASFGVRYAIECRREGLNSFWCPATSLKETKVQIRGFYPSFYHIRVFSYNADFRSPSSNEVTMNFGVPYLVDSSEESQDGRTPFSRSESV